MGTREDNTSVVSSGGEMSLWREMQHLKVEKHFFKEGTISKAEGFWKQFGAKSLTCFS